jgi:predicted site-specific integrase-resolvase
MGVLFLKETCSMAALPRFVPLPKAAEQLSMSEDELRRLVDSGKIDAIALPDGDVAVSEKDMAEPLRKEDLPEYKKHSKWIGIGIGINEGAKKYNIPYTTLYRWYKRGLIKKIGSEGQKILLDRADVAYCAEIYSDQGAQGKRIFNADGTPYITKSG